jgi:uncharacterized protein involved in exopolysaccharide biosynthesis
MEQSSNQVFSPADLSFRDLLDHVWRRKLVVAACSVAFAAAGAAIAFFIEARYDAQIVISPVLGEAGASQLGALGTIASQYSGLASLAGLSMAGGGRNQEALAVLQSELLTQRYIRDNGLLPVLYPDRWDVRTKTWKTDDGQKAPTLWRASQLFKGKVRSLTQERKTGLYVLSIEWTDPTLAAKWANDLVHLTNAYLREKAVRESERNIAYLNEQAARTDVVEVRRAIYALLQEELNKQMLARGRDEYALRIIDPATAPEAPSSPSALILAFIGLVVGGLVATAGILLLQMLSRPAEPAG